MYDKNKKLYIIVKYFLLILNQFLFIDCDTIEDKFFFLIKPPKNQETIINAFTPNYNLIAINTSKENNSIIIKNKISETAIKNISSIILFKDKLIIKTCFGPNKIVEIINEKNETFLHKNDNSGNNLKNIIYCYSSEIYDSRNENKSLILTYWTEIQVKNKKENYLHKIILFDINKNKFSEEIVLKSKTNFYTKNCISLTNTEIGCNIYITDNFLNHQGNFTIESKNIYNYDNIDLNLNENSISDYYEILKNIISYNIPFKDFFVNNYDLFMKIISNQTNIFFSIINKFNEAINSTTLETISNFIKIRLKKFNYFFDDDKSLILLYIDGNNNLRMNRYDTNYYLINYKLFALFSPQYLRKDICENPKYIQGIMFNSLINYNEQDQEYIKKNGGLDNFYKYQKEIATLIACENDKKEVFYEFKKIPILQCLNRLDNINGKYKHVIKFKKNENSIEFDIYNDPNYKSLRTSGISFIKTEEDISPIEIRFKTIRGDDHILNKYAYNNTIYTITHLKFTKPPNLRGKPISIYYYLSQNEGIYHLFSEKCELEIHLEDEEKCDDPNCKYCNGEKCIKCTDDIKGLIYDSEIHKCVYDKNKGFKQVPEKNMCVCKEGFHFYKNINNCENEMLIPSNCSIEHEDKSLKPIYCPDRNNSSTGGGLNGNFTSDYPKGSESQESGGEDSYESQISGSESSNESQKKGDESNNESQKSGGESSNESQISGSENSKESQISSSEDNKESQNSRIESSSESQNNGGESSNESQINGRESSNESSSGSQNNGGESNNESQKTGNESSNESQKSGSESNNENQNSGNESSNENQKTGKESNNESQISGSGSSSESQKSESEDNNESEKNGDEVNSESQKNNSEDNNESPKSTIEDKSGSLYSDYVNSTETLSTDNLDNIFNETDEIYCLDSINLTTNLWFSFEEYNFYYSKIKDCVYIFDDNLDLFFYSNRHDCSFDSSMIYNISECLNKSYLTQKEDYENLLDNSIEYDPYAKNITIFRKIEKNNSIIKSIHFHLVNKQKREDISDIQLSEEVINEIKNISDIPEDLNLLIFKADINRTDMRLTQVEYQFYNPIPSKINEKIIFANAADTEKNNLRRLDDIFVNISNIMAILTLPINLSDEDKEKMKNFNDSFNACIFDLSDSFFTDICSKYTIPEIPKAFLKERYDEYYIPKPSCQENCKPFNEFNCFQTTKLICQCPINIKIDLNYENKFYDKINKFPFPSMFILKCYHEVLNNLFEGRLEQFLFSINFLLLAVYLGLYIFFKRNLFYLKFIICSFLNALFCNKCFKDKFKDLSDLIAIELNYLKGKDEDEDGDNKNEKENISSPKEHEYKEDENNKNFKEDNNLMRAYNDDDDLFDRENENLIDFHNQQKDLEKKILKELDENEEKKSTQTNQVDIINTRKELIIEDEKEIKKDELIEEDENAQKDELNTKNNSNNNIFNQNNESQSKENHIETQIINVDSKLKSNESSIKKSDKFSDENSSNASNKNNSMLTLNSNNKKKENNNEEKNNNNTEEENKKTQNNLLSNVKKNINKKRNLKNFTHKLIEQKKNLNDEDKKTNEEEQKNSKDEEDKNDNDNNKDKEKDKFSEKSIFKFYNQNQNPYDLDSESNFSFINNNNGNLNFEEPSKINDLISKESKDIQSQINTEENGKDLISHIDISNIGNSIEKKNENEENLDSEALDIIDLTEENNLSQDYNGSKENSTIINNNFISKKKKGDNKGKKNANPPYKGQPLESSETLNEEIKKKIYNILLDEYKKERKNYLKKRIDRIEYSRAFKLDKRPFCKMLCDTFMKNNTFIFIIKFCKDNEDFYSKITVAILTIYLYIFVNLIIMFNSSNLYLYIPIKRKEGFKEFDLKSFFVSIIFPYLALVFPINNLKKYTSMENNIDDIYYKIYDTLIGYIKFLLKKKAKNMLNDSKTNLKIHKIETEISITKNKSDKRAYKLFFFGGLFIIFTWYYLECFCYIYHYSVEPLYINIIFSISSAFFISFIPYLISVGCRKAALTIKNEYLFIISNLLNPQYEFCREGKTKKK